MLIKHQRQWDIYTASKEAQMINIKPRKYILPNYSMQEIIALACGVYVGLVLALNLVLLPMLLIWIVGN